jgi:small-conductance mechanosensitive channel
MPGFQRPAWITLLLLTAGVPAAPLPSEPAPAQAAAADAELPEVPVRMRHEVLFQVRAQVGDLTPAERARAIEATLASLVPSAASAVRVEERAGSSDLVAAGTFVLSVTDIDAAATGRTRQQLAADWARNLRDALEREGKGRSVRGVLVAVLLSVVATALLGLSLRLLRRLFPRLEAALRAWQGTHIRSVQVRGFDLLTERRLVDLLVGLARLLRPVVVLLLVAAWLDAVLGFFAWTRWISRAALEWTAGVLGDAVGAVVAFVPNLLAIAAVLVGARLLLRGARLVTGQLASGALALPGFHREWSEPTYGLARVLVLALAAALVYPQLPGAVAPAFAAVGLFLGILLLVASAPAAGHLVAGVALSYARPFSVGDRVEIAGVAGEVIERTPLAVRLRTAGNEEVTLGNARVLAAQVVNLSAAARAGGLRVDVPVAVAHDVPWRTVQDLLLAAAAATPGLRPEPAPFVLHQALDGAAALYRLHAFTDRVEEPGAVASRLHQAIQDRFAEAGVALGGAPPVDP